MFGYIAPQKDELKVRELAEYNGIYCGLCKTIGRRYSQLARLCLSYDCAFLAALIMGMYPCGGYEKKRCALKPFKKPCMCARNSAALDFAADANVLLSYYKMEDDWRDEKKLSAFFGRLLLSCSAKKAARNAPELADAIQSGLCDISAVEARGSSEIDEAAHAFAAMMSCAAALAPVPADMKDTLRSFMFDLGRWLYLIDAWDDRKKDSKTGSYNVFNIAGADSERARFVLNCNINEAIKLFELIDFKSGFGLLDNIIHLGIVEKTVGILASED